jgi:hypothetical protein
MMTVPQTLTMTMEDHLEAIFRLVDDKGVVPQEIKKPPTEMPTLGSVGGRRDW